MTAFHFPTLSLLASGFLCVLLTGCGNDLSLPKANTELPAQSANPSQANLSDHSTEPAKNTLTETLPEKKSMWVTLAGMKCH